MDLFFHLGQRKHTKHYHFSHFNLQTQHIYGKTPDIETQTQKERTYGSYISLYTADRKTKRFVCIANKSMKATAMQYRNSPQDSTTNERLQCFECGTIKIKARHM